MFKALIRWNKIVTWHLVDDEYGEILWAAFQIGNVGGGVIKGDLLYTSKQKREVQFPAAWHALFNGPGIVHVGHTLKQRVELDRRLALWPKGDGIVELLELHAQATAKGWFISKAELDQKSSERGSGYVNPWNEVCVFIKSVEVGLHGGSFGLERIDPERIKKARYAGVQLHPGPGNEVWDSVEELRKRAHLFYKVFVLFTELRGRNFPDLVEDFTTPTRELQQTANYSRRLPKEFDVPGTCGMQELLDEHVRFTTAAADLLSTKARGCLKETTALVGLSQQVVEEAPGRTLSSESSMEEGEIRENKSPDTPVLTGVDVESFFQECMASGSEETFDLGSLAASWHPIEKVGSSSSQSRIFDFEGSENSNEMAERMLEEALESARTTVPKLKSKREGKKAAVKTMVKTAARDIEVPRVKDKSERKSSVDSRERSWHRADAPKTALDIRIEGLQKHFEGPEADLKGYEIRQLEGRLRMLEKRFAGLDGGARK